MEKMQWKQKQKSNKKKKKREREREKTIFIEFIIYLFLIPQGGIFPDQAASFHPTYLESISG